jgi:hypothetical protein
MPKQNKTETSTNKEIFMNPYINPDKRDTEIIQTIANNVGLPFLEVQKVLKEYFDVYEQTVFNSLNIQ